MNAFVESLPRWLCLGALLLSAGCAKLPPATRVEPSADLFFREKIVGVLNRNCTVACHGVSWPIYAKHRNTPPHLRHRMTFEYPVDAASGTIRTTEEARIALERCRERAPAGGARRIDRRYPARFSPLVRMPLARAYGNAKHGGGDVFAAPEESDFRELLRWVELEIAASPEPSTLRPHPGAEFFRARVMPVLLKKGCLGANCHGGQAFNDLRFDAGVSFGARPYGAIVKGVSYPSEPASSGLDRQSPARGRLQLALPGPRAEDVAESIRDRFTDEMIRANRVRALGAALGDADVAPIAGEPTAFVSLGDVTQSKFLAKNLPLAEGGLLHKGGNNFFSGRDDPDYRTLVEWLQLEKAVTQRSLVTAGRPITEEIGRLQGVLFVRTRLGNHRRFFDVDRFLPGARLLMLPIGWGETPLSARSSIVDLSAQMGLTGEEDVRSPCVSYDARRVLFAMRRTPAEGFDIHELELDEKLSYRPGSLRRLTWGPARVNGVQVHFVTPSYTPDPDDPGRRDLGKVSVTFASNLAGLLTPSEPRGILGEATGGDRSTIMDAARSEASGTFTGRRVSVVRGAASGQWARVVAHTARAGRPAVLRVEPPFTVSIDAGTVYVLDVPDRDLPGLLPAYQIYRLRHALPGQERAAFEKTLQRVTFDSSQDLDPSMRSSGEIMFTSLRALRYRGGKPIYNAGLFRAHPSGANFHPHNMNRSGYPVVTDNRELPSGIEVRIAMDPRNLWGGGALLFSDHQFGPDIEVHNPLDDLVAPYGPEAPSRAGPALPGSLRIAHSAFRFLRSTMPFFPERGTRAVVHTGVSPGGFFRDPAPMPDGSVVVAHFPAPIDHLDPRAGPDTDLYVARPKAGLQREDEGGPGEMILYRVPAASSPGVAEIYPRPVVVRLKEPVLRDHFEVARHGMPSRVNGFSGYSRSTTAFVECYDYLTLDQLLPQLAPVGRRAVATPRDWESGQPVAPGDAVAFVRAVIAVPAAPGRVTPVSAADVANGDPASTTVSNGIHGVGAIACEVPLPEDGSFYLEIPPGSPFYLQSLNSDRMALRTFDKLLYAIPGETLRMSAPRRLFPMICGGCHGSITGRRDDVLRPPDAVTSASRVDATWDRLRLAKKLPHNHGAGALGLTGVDFVRTVQPIIDRKCATAGCHSGAAPAGKLALTGEATRHYNRAYENLLQLEEPESRDYGRKKYVAEREGLAIESALIEKLYGRELRAPRSLRGETPHPRNPALTEEEKLTFVRWIDLGATFRGWSPASGRHAGGRER